MTPKKPKKHRPRRIESTRSILEGTTTERGYGHRWQRLRRMLLGLPGWQLCRHCERSGRVTQTEILDHIRPIREGGEILDPANLQPLCRSCHKVKTDNDLRQAGTIR